MCTKRKLATVKGKKAFLPFTVANLRLVHISVPFVTTVVTLVTEVVFLEPYGQETRATGFLGGYDGVYAGWNAKTQWVLYWMWLFLGKSGQWGCY